MKIVSKFASLLVAGCAMLAAPAIAQDGDEPLPKGEVELAEMLDGRVAGEPQRCVRTSTSRGIEIIDDTALVIREGRTIWVNRTRNPRSLDDNDFLVIRKFGSGRQLCRLDNVTTHDRFGNFFTGVIMLEDFVPYRKSEDSKAS